MNWLDAVLAIPMLWGLYKGFTKGFIMELARIIALLVGVYMSIRFAQAASDYLYRNTEITNSFLPIIAFVIIFIVAVILVHLFAKAIEKLATAVALGWANKIAGACFGIFRTAFVLSVVLMLLSRFDLTKKFEKEKIATASYLFKPVSELAPFVLPMLEDIDKDTWIDHVDRKIDKVEDTIRDIIHE
ncbi:CvpA family protein [Bacteroidota bacterium]